MPITKELENINKLESVGFTHEQAKVLTGVIEQSHVDSQENLKGFISEKFEEAGRELDRRFEEVDRKFDDINKRFEDVDKRFDDISKRFEDVDKRFDDISNAFDNKLEDISNTFNNKLEYILKDFNRQFERISEGFPNLELRIKASHTDLLMKFFGIVAGCITVGIAVARFLW